MMGHTHSPAGTMTWMYAAPLVTDDPSVVLAGAVLTFMLPLGADLDHPNSRSSRALFGPFHRYAGNTVATLMGGHRAGMHSLWAILAVGLLCFLGAGLAQPQWAVPFGVAGLLGWAAGVWPDMLTKQGVKVLWPLSSRVYGVRIFSTGGWGELVVRLACYAGILHATYRLWGAS